MKRREREMLAIILQQHERHCQELTAIILKMITAGQDGSACDDGPPAPGLPVPGVHDNQVPPEPAEHLRAYR